MVTPNSSTLRKLNRLDTASPEFGDKLCNIFHLEEYKQCAPNLEGGDLAWLVDYLDMALDILEPSGTAFRKCLSGLRSICGAKGILPTSCTCLSQLLYIGTWPFVSGGCGEVYHGTLNGSTVCVKRVRIYTIDPPETAMRAFCQEAVMWKRLTHPNIMPLLGVTVTPHLQLISDWMSRGNLPEYIRGSSDVDHLGLLLDTAQGLSYLHSRNVIHGDLKGANILVDDSCHARITDFGLAMVTRNLDSIPTTTHQHGHTIRWAAPEVMDKGTYSMEADMFSFAMVMIEVFTGAIPFKDSSNWMAMSSIMQGTYPPKPIHPSFTESLWFLMQQCWNQKPHLRPSVSEVLKVLFDPGIPGWKQLITQPLTKEECISLITELFSDSYQVETVRSLSGGDAKCFVDKIDEVLDCLIPRIHKECLHYLYRICGCQQFLPRSLEVPLCYDPAEDPVFYGGFADVWKGEHKGQEVSAQVIGVWPGDDNEEVKRRFCREAVMWRALSHPNVLPLLGVTMTENQLVMVTEWIMGGNIMEFTRANTNADWLELLRGVTRGLIYLHEQGIVHGNIQGENILISNDGNAQLTNFSLAIITSDQSTIALPQEGRGTVRWMSPELLNPEEFGLENSHPTMESDCYALGMVIYEVFSGQAPFAMYRDPQVLSLILQGKRPQRPQGNKGNLFTDQIWEMLEGCWKQQPGDRLSASDILMHLERHSSLLHHQQIWWNTYLLPFALSVVAFLIFCYWVM